MTTFYDYHPTPGRTPAEDGRHYWSFNDGAFDDDDHIDDLHGWLREVERREGDFKLRAYLHYCYPTARNVDGRRMEADVRVWNMVKTAGGIIGDLSETRYFVLPLPPPPPCPVQPGARILRPLRYGEARNKYVADEPEFEQRNGTYSFRLEPILSDAGLLSVQSRVGCLLSPRDPQAQVAAYGRVRHGLVCICREEIPTDWIAFEVVGVAKSQKAAFVKPVRGTTDELLAMYHTEGQRG